MTRSRNFKSPPSRLCDQSSPPPKSIPPDHNPRTKFPPSLPTNWPPHLTYLARPICSPNLTPSELSTLHTPPSNQFPSSFASSPSSPIPASGPYPHISIQPIRSPPSHPALNQYGLFATQPLPPGSFICDYMGYIHPSHPPNFSPHLGSRSTILAAGTAREKVATVDMAASGSSPTDTNSTTLGLDMDAAATSSDYGLSLHRELGIGIDASTCGNEARFINDYRGIRATPNAQLEEHWVRLPVLSGDRPQEPWQQKAGGHERRWKWELRMGVFVTGLRRDGKGVGKKGILAGDEIVVSYGKGFWRERGTRIVEGCEDHGMRTCEYGEPIKKGERRLDICRKSPYVKA